MLLVALSAIALIAAFSMAGWQSATADTVSGTTIPTGTNPYYLAVSPDGSKVYVANITGTITVIHIDASTGLGTVTGPPITVPGASGGLFGIAFSPVDDLALVSNAATGSIAVLDTKNDQVTQTLSLGPGAFPWGIAFQPDGSEAYVASFDGKLRIIDIVHGVATVSATQVTVGLDPIDVAVTPDGKTVLVTNSGSNTVSVIATSSNSVTQALTGFTGPWGVAVSPDGSKAYVTNTGNSTVGIVDLTGGTAMLSTSTIALANNPLEVAFSPDGGRAYVTGNSSDTVAVVDVATDSLDAATPTLGVDNDPVGVAVSPDGTTAYVANDQSNTVSVITNASVAPAFSANALPSGTVSSAYSSGVHTSFGRPTYSLAAGSSLPSGLTLDSATGAITGTPTASGTFTFSVVATGSNGQSTAKAFTVTIKAALAATGAGDATIPLLTAGGLVLAGLVMVATCEYRRRRPGHFMIL